MNSYKIFQIIKREYITRVRSKAFIITTALVPFGFFLFFAIAIGVQFLESDTEYKVGIHDSTTEVYPHLAVIDSATYIDVTGRNLDQLRQQVIDGEIDGYVAIGDEHVTTGKKLELIYGGSGGIAFIDDVEDDLQTAIREERLNRADLSDDVKSILKSGTSLETRKLTKEGKEESGNPLFYTAFGYIMAFAMYGAIFIYGFLVMRAVIEEKTSRIVEIIISSVKPVELLLGKVLGVGAVGLTQFLIWIFASIAIMAGISPVAALFITPEMIDAAQAAGSAEAAVPQIPEIGISVWIYFLIFFLLGYLAYTSILAALGAAVDNESDVQQFTLPVTIPIIIAILLLARIVAEPNSNLAIITSIAPLLSPILMVARIPITDVPFWQLGLSILLMVLTFWGMLWLAAKIYRVGILMYGKKPSFREIVKWARQG